MAEGRYLSDELTLYYGLVPRTNRGIFAINQLPDLAERYPSRLAQCARGAMCRCLQGRGPPLLTPCSSPRPTLRTTRTAAAPTAVEGDRFGAQIRTHYPLLTSIRECRGICEAGGCGRSRGAGDPRISVPEYMTEIVATLSHLARSSPHINQRSGVSVRLTVSNSETLVANAPAPSLASRRARCGCRVSDLEALASSTAGKVEIETIEDGRDEQIIEAPPCAPPCYPCSKNVSAPKPCAT